MQAAGRLRRNDRYRVPNHLLLLLLVAASKLRADAGPQAQFTAFGLGRAGGGGGEG